MTAAALTDEAKAVVKAIKPDYDMLVLVVPMYSGLDQLQAADALLELKKKKLIAFEGRGRSRSIYLTDEGKDAYSELFGAGE